MDCLFVYLSFFLNPQHPNFGGEGPEAKYHHPDPTVATALNIRLLNQYTIVNYMYECFNINIT